MSPLVARDNHRLPPATDPRAKPITGDSTHRFRQGPTFPEGDPWLELWGNAVVQDDDDLTDRVIIRTEMKWNPTKGEYEVLRRFLKEWASDFADSLQTSSLERSGNVTTAHTAPLALYLLDAKRDVADDFRVRGSVWHRLISDPGIAEDDVAEIEQTLSELNETIVGKSSVLTHLSDHFSAATTVLACDTNGIAINPLARRLGDLTRGMDITMSTRGAASFPLVRQGMGTRSLSAVLLFHAFMAWQQSRRGGTCLHPFVAIEELESHLHPHAQRSLYHEIIKIPGQRLVSTHSPYICGQAPIADFRHFYKERNVSRVSAFDMNGLTEDDLRKLNQSVMNSRGDIVFSRCLVLFEGETEEQALPIFAEHLWQCNPNNLGVSFTGVGGHSNYLPFLRLATSFRIPWVILSDGESTALAAVDSALSAIHEAPSNSNPNVFCIPNGLDFEGMLANADYEAILKATIVELLAANAQHAQALQHEWSAKSLNDVLTYLRSWKTRCAVPVARAITAHGNTAIQCPPLVKALLDRVNDQLKPAPVVAAELSLEPDLA